MKVVQHQFFLQKEKGDGFIFSIQDRWGGGPLRLVGDGPAGLNP
jgi:hypothetical protein